MERPDDQSSGKDRSAGILMHITSLPGPAFIGDIGPAARAFAEFLYRSNQTYWQLLPVQPIGADQGYSPYSSSSAVAGNPLLISPELLVEEGLLDNSDIIHDKKGSNKTDYDAAKKYKEKLLDKAYRNWFTKSSEETLVEFEQYKQKQSYWLTDFALYAVIKNIHNNAPWYEWPGRYKDRDEKSLREFTEKNSGEISKVKWIQMIFDKQWQQLNAYCESLQIKLIGDIPYYVAHDSADVWCNRDIFTLDEEGQLTGISGVPPDLFNDEGQLWGMPLFKWDVLKAKNYDWWITRLRKNLEYFDIVRLDHFRAFASYWAVPAGASSAKSGEWKKGPGKDFFQVVKTKFGKLPFIAEDLGEIDEDVYILRDEVELPGMNVLQFAFGNDMPQSPYLPHHHIRNSLVYTGTHDNNTTRGWFKEAKSEERKNISEYLGMKMSEKNISDQLCRTAYMSVSKLAIIPIQDILNLDASARMNTPATPGDNWQWRMEKNQLTDSIEKKLNRWCFYFGRIRD
jgi:4-alpha-glucanotransferase